MELKIEVGEERFKEVIEKELNAFTQEELHDICKKALINVMSDPDVFRSLFVTQENVGNYWDNNVKWYANDILREAAKNISFEETFKDLQDRIIAYMRENHEDIFRNIVADMFMRGFRQTMYEGTDFNNAVRNEIWSWNADNHQ